MNGPTELLTVADICRKLGVSRAWVIEHSNGRRRPVLPSGDSTRPTFRVLSTTAGELGNQESGAPAAGYRPSLR